MFLLVCGIKFGKAKQKVVALVATTLKTLISIAKTNGRIAGRKCYAGNINYFLWNVLVHISPEVNKKGAQPKPRTENRKLQLLLHKLN